MATVRSGALPVLMIVDVQVGVVRDAWDAPRIVANVARAVERARSARVPVIWVQHADHEMPRDSAAWQWVPELVPAPGEARIHKAWNSAFEETGLDALLERLGASRIVLAGAASNWCIRATAHAALERGYDLTLLSDAHTTGSMTLEDGTRIEAARVVDELNIAMTWMQYPGRVTNTSTAQGADFGAATAA